MPSSVNIYSAVSEMKHADRQVTLFYIQGLLSLHVVLCVEKACEAGDMT
jgi:hypothetical protein